MNKNGKIQGLVSAIAIWLSLDRLTPRRLDEPADIYVPIFVFLVGISGAVGAWKGKCWGYLVLFLFAVLQLVALGVGGRYIGYGELARGRGAEIAMIVALAIGAARLLFRTMNPRELDIKEDSTNNLTEPRKLGPVD